jgi:dTMP kinase
MAGTPGRFITLEGGEGGGKTTQAARLAARLQACGLTVELTREPGGTPGAEAIRRLLVEGPPERWLPLDEAFLHIAARHDHTERRIRPALVAGSWVICDRYLDSTRVYQGLAGGVDAAAIDALHVLAVGNLRPDLTLVLDVDPARGLDRRRRAGGAGRYEAMDTAFHARVRAGFRELAAGEPERCVLIPADGAPDAVAETIWTTVGARFGLVP